MISASRMLGSLFAIVLAFTTTFSNAETIAETISTLPRSDLNTIKGLIANDAFLNSTTGNYTLFAPTDAAFASGQKPGYAIVSGVISPYTAVNYYVLNNTVDGSQFIWNNQAALGATPVVHIRTGTSDILINATAIYPALNGYVYVLDKTLTPPQVPSAVFNSSTLNSLAMAQVSKFSAALASTGLSRYVDSLTGGKYTIFAPNDQAFGLANATTANLTTGQLRSVLLYHIVTGCPASTLFPASAAYPSQLQNLSLPVNVNATGNTVVVGTDSTILFADLTCTAGFIDVIDHLALPVIPNGGAIPESAVPAYASATTSTAAASTATATPSLNANSGNSLSGGSSRSISNGGIAGLTVGLLAALAIVLCCCCFCCRKRLGWGEGKEDGGKSKDLDIVSKAGAGSAAPMSNVSAAGAAGFAGVTAAGTGAYAASRSDVEAGADGLKNISPLEEIRRVVPFGALGGEGAAGSAAGAVHGAEADISEARPQ